MAEFYEPNLSDFPTSSDYTIQMEFDGDQILVSGFQLPPNYEPGPEEGPNYYYIHIEQAPNSGPAGNPITYTLPTDPHGTPNANITVYVWVSPENDPTTFIKKEKKTALIPKKVGG